MTVAAILVAVVEGATFAFPEGLKFIIITLCVGAESAEAEPLEA